MILGTAGAKGAGILRWRDSDLAAEEPLKVMRRIADSGGERGERWRFPCPFDQLHRLRRSESVGLPHPGGSADKGGNRQ